MRPAPLAAPLPAPRRPPAAVAAPFAWGRLLAPVLAAFALAGPAPAQEAGDFDYWVLSLSWSPSWCATEGDARDEQCARGLGWILHGLWPQHERGWPSWCRHSFQDPSRREAADMADIMGSAGLARHAWDKHGSCSGLSPEDYFALSREAYLAVVIPQMFTTLAEPQEVSAAAVEAAFLGANPGLDRDQLTVTCGEGRIEEVRLCLTPDLAPRRCGDDVIRDCRMRDALLEAP